LHRNELNTLEPQLVDAKKDNLAVFYEVFSINKNKHDTCDKSSEYMQEHKTDCAMKIFNSDKHILFPEYINKVIDWCDEQ